MESLCDNDVTSSSLINLKLFGPIVDINYKNPRLSIVYISTDVYTAITLDCVTIVFLIRFLGIFKTALLLGIV